MFQSMWLKQQKWQIQSRPVGSELVSVCIRRAAVHAVQVQRVAQSVCHCVRNLERSDLHQQISVLNPIPLI